MRMTAEIKNICDRIESLMTVYRDNKHDLLYEKTMQVLSSIEFSAIFITETTLPLHRVRPNYKDNTPFIKATDLNYAPPEYVSNYGRVNRPGQSMFYCAEDPNICNLELLYDYLLKNDDGHEGYATHSKWNITDKLYLLVIAIAPSNREYYNTYTLRKDCTKFIESQPMAMRNNYNNLYSLTEHFFLINAKNDPSVYVVCSAIANYLTLQYPSIDGLIYPSVQGNTGYNFVLRPHTINNKMITPESDVSMEKWTVANGKKLNNATPNFKKGHIIGDNIVWYT
ncbi:MAG: RES domain-containing protein [Flavobacteriia bacterium]|nr:RES domain-containing protein [Flavobacteriia bacterium]